jgi:hypothetical protein
MTANVWLVRSPEVNKQKFLNVFNLLQSIKGYFKFRIHEQENKGSEEKNLKNKKVSNHKQDWDFFFQIADSFRRDYNIGESEYVVVLSDIENTFEQLSDLSMI